MVMERSKKKDSLEIGVESKGNKPNREDENSVDPLYVKRRRTSNYAGIAVINNHIFLHFFPLHIL